MKAVLGLLALPVLLGVAYALAFVGVIPAQKMADRSPALGKTLIALRLAHAKRPAHAAPAPARVSPEPQALDDERPRLQADRAPLDKDRAAWEAQKQPAPPAAAPAGGGTDAAADTAAKLNAIYATMSPEDLARLFARQPDADVIGALSGFDEKKAGKVLAALPADRAARLAHGMAHPAAERTAAGTPRATL